jgi:hypothetical protein
MLRMRWGNEELGTQVGGNLNSLGLRSSLDLLEMLWLHGGMVVDVCDGDVAVQSKE